MKSIRKFLITILCVVLSLNAIIQTISAKENDNDGGHILEQLYLQQQKEEANLDDVDYQDKLCKIYDEIEQSMLQQPIISAQSICQDDDIVLNRYAENYAGCYIRDEKLVICTTDGQVPQILYDESVEYEVVQNSYNDLANIQNYITSKYEGLYKEYFGTVSDEFELLSSLCGVGIDESLNMLVVDIVDLTDRKIETFIKLFGYAKFVTFRDAEDLFEEYYTYKPGRGIYVIVSRDNGDLAYARISIGYRAYMPTTAVGNLYGFVTCAHGVRDSIDKKVYTETSTTYTLGTIEAYAYGATVDFAFVKVSGRHDIGTSVMFDENGTTSDGDKINEGTYMTNVAWGTKVYKVGSTTYKTSGTVVSTNYSETVDGYSFTNLTRVLGKADNGDSGGLVYVNYGGYTTAGILRSGNSMYYAYVKATSVIDAMNVYPY